MASLKGTQTEKNIIAAFAGESQARNRYDYFASTAKKEGYIQISAVFEETARQEKEHAKRLFKFLEGGTAEVVTSYPAGIIGTTAANLKAAAAGEHEEWTSMYPGFADIADDEGFPEVAKAMRHIAIAESNHEATYLTLLKRVEEKNVFTREDTVVWRCRNCGFIYTGKTAPEKCPACVHPRDYFEVRADNY